MYRIAERPLHSAKAGFTISVTHDLNAFWLISVTLSGISILLIPEQYSNVLSLISVSFSESFTVSRLEQPENALLPMLLTLSGTVISFKLLQEANVPLPIFFNTAGSITFSSEEHLSNALSPMFLTFSGITISFNAVQLENVPSCILIIPPGN